MQLVLNISQLFIVGLLVICILLQQKESGLGAAFGGSGQLYSTKRGAEKIIFIATIILSVLFLGVSLGNFIWQ